MRRFKHYTATGRCPLCDLPPLRVPRKFFFMAVDKCKEIRERRQPRESTQGCYCLWTVLPGASNLPYCDSGTRKFIHKEIFNLEKRGSLQCAAIAPVRQSVPHSCGEEHGGTAITLQKKQPSDESQAVVPTKTVPDPQERLHDVVLGVPNVGHD
jgi:hypothetical protein